MPGEEVHVGADRVGQRGAQRGAAAGPVPFADRPKGGRGGAVTSLERPLEDRPVQTRLGAEEIARRPPREIGGRADVGEAGRLEAALGEEALGGGQERVAAAPRIAAALLLPLGRLRPF